MSHRFRYQINIHFYNLENCMDNIISNGYHKIIGFIMSKGNENNGMKMSGLGMHGFHLSVLSNCLYSLI